MIARWLGLDGDARITSFGWAGPWPSPGLILAGLLAAAAIYAGILYWRERSLSVPRRITLGILRALLLGLVVLILFEPVAGVERILELPRTVLVLLDASESMGIRDERSPTGAPAARIERAKEILTAPGRGILERLGEGTAILLHTFGDRLHPIAEADPDAARILLRGIEPDLPATHLGSAIEEAAARTTGRSIAGVILLTDGASNGGIEPIEAARRLRDRGIPILPIGLGLADPPDVRIDALIVQGTVFAKDRVPVRIRVSSRGYTGKEGALRLSLDGVEVASKTVAFAGGGEFHELVFEAERAATSARLEASIAPLEGEVAGDNNRARSSIRIIDQKIRVLYIEGKPRWEYRYLRQVLLRDHRIDATFLLADGDRDLAAASREYLADFPEDAATVFAYDCVILGDVPASFFSATALARMEELVRARGASFLMIAGSRHAPAEYADTPVASILPVRIRRQGMADVPDEVFPVVTEEGSGSPVMSLLPSDRANRELWSAVRPLHRLPPLDGAKPGATVLAGLSNDTDDRDGYPLIAWHRYGTGKVLFVGTGDLWRLRFGAGDTHHARFWGQAVQFLTLSRLLGEGERIDLEADRTSCRTGERIRVTANVRDEACEPVAASSYDVEIERPGPPLEARRLRLQAVPGIPGLFQGTFVPERGGRYRIRAVGPDEAIASSAAVDVEEAPPEMLEPALQEDLLRRIAAATGGCAFSAKEVDDLPDRIVNVRRTVVTRRDRELWDLPIAFGALLLLAGLEWLIRRLNELM
ncbi:MAG: VWA domain-containing protein [Planctomycetes bacterium]|nr:VWA domain-containing protein [Planctomycetota bacterium]